MKKSLKSIILAGVLSLSLSASVFGGSWQSDFTGYWYQNDDGTYPVNCWQWIDDNHDGIAESYYFDDKGYILVNTTTPDGYSVDTNGAWIVNGIVQTQVVSAPSVPVQPQQQEVSQSEESQTRETPAQTARSGISSSPYDGYTIIVNTSTKKYHRPGCASVSKMKDKNKGYASDASYLESLGYSPCKNCH